MRYLLAIILPPVAVLMCGKPFQAILNVVLWCLFIVPGVIHALFVVHSHLADIRQKALIEEMRREQEALLAAIATAPVAPAMPTMPIQAV